MQLLRKVWCHKRSAFWNRIQTYMHNTKISVKMNWSLNLQENILKKKKKLLKSTGHLWQLSKTSLLTWCIPTYASNNKPVNIWTQLVVEKWKKKHPCRRSNVVSDALILRPQLSWGLEFNSNIFVRNYFFLKNYVTSEGAVSPMFYTINSSPLLVTN